MGLSEIFSCLLNQNRTVGNLKLQTFDPLSSLVNLLDAVPSLQSTSNSVILEGLVFVSGHHLAGFLLDLFHLVVHHMLGKCTEGKGCQTLRSSWNFCGDWQPTWTNICETVVFGGLLALWCLLFLRCRRNKGIYSFPVSLSGSWLLHLWLYVALMKFVVREDDTLTL